MPGASVLYSDVICIKNIFSAELRRVNIGARCVCASVVVLPMALSSPWYVTGNGDDDVFRQKVNSAQLTTDVCGLHGSVSIRLT